MKRCHACGDPINERPAAFVRLLFVREIVTAMLCSACADHARGFLLSNGARSEPPK